MSLAQSWWTRSGSRRPFGEGGPSDTGVPGSEGTRGAPTDVTESVQGQTLEDPTPGTESRRQGNSRRGADRPRGHEGWRLPTQRPSAAVSRHDVARTTGGQDEGPPARTKSARPEEAYPFLKTRVAGDPVIHSGREKARSQRG